MASLLLSTGKYLHTAYAVSNIAEEFTNDDWSLSSQEGFGYIGQYIDDSAVDSSDPTDYVWTEFLDEDVDDLDDEGDMPMADFQSQIDALQDQVEVLQGDAENLQSGIEVNASNVADSAQLASEAADIANATGQYFWHDANGAHVSTGENNPEGERNSIWNSLGMLFRKGATNLLAVLAGGASGTDPKGIAVYDGQGNNAENVVASFTDSGSVIGKVRERRLELDSDSMDLYDVGNRRVFSVLNTTSDTLGTVYEFAVNRGDNKGVGTYTYQLGLPYEGDLVVELLFYDEPNYAGGYGEEYSLNDGDFGNFTFSNVSMSASGNLSFDTDTNTVTLVLSSLTSGYHLSRFLISYTSYPQYPTVFIGANGDTFDIKDYALVVASPDWEHNALTIDRNGNMNTDGNVTVGSHSSHIGTVEDAYPTSAKSVSNNTWTNICSITLDAGVWLVNAYVRFPSNATGYRQANLSPESADSAVHISVSACNGQATQLVFSKIFQSSVSTTYYLNVRHNAGSALSLQAGSVQAINAIRAIRIV